jgi:L-lysine 6-transaminase
MQPHDVMSTLDRNLLVDGYDLVLDLDASQGSRLVDARDGTSYLDMFTFFASNALGFNHPRLHEPDAEAALLRSARHKPSNSDVYTVDLARFVETFQRVLGVPELPHMFMIEGGALAVANMCKAAVDYKSRRNEAAGRSPELGMQVLHLESAFHGRGGYTMSLTNTDPRKVDRFPKFDWPRIPTPSLRFPLDANADANLAAEDASLAAARAAFEANPHDIALILVEPIQGEGGDAHLSQRYLQGLYALTEEFECLFGVDEVQTGAGFTGTPWAYQQLGVQPDLLSFGKKLHVCGVLGGGRIDEEPQNVFRTSSRINSTFGGSLTDMVRATLMLEVYESEGLIDHAAKMGDHLLARLTELQERHDVLSQARGRGLWASIDVASGELRDAISAHLYAHEHVILLGCGPQTLRFRPTMTVTEAELDEAVDALDRAVTALTA